MGRLLIALLLLTGCGKQIEIGDTLKAHKFNPDNICAAEARCSVLCENTYNGCLDNFSAQVCDDFLSSCYENRAGDMLDWYGEPY